MAATTWSQQRSFSFSFPLNQPRGTLGHTRSCIFSRHRFRHEGAQEDSGQYSLLIRPPVRASNTVPQLRSSKSQESSSSKTKESKAAAAAAAAPPPPPPNSAKPLPQPSSAVASLSHLANNNSSHSLTSTNGSLSSTRSASSNSVVGAASQRGYNAPDRAAPAPPIVVVSPDTSAEPIERTSLDGGPNTPPRAGTLNRLRTGPKDTIPIVGKPPRKQRSSRFVITEKVEIEKLPPFMGTWLALTMLCAI